MKDPFETPQLFGGRIGIVLGCVLLGVAVLLGGMCYTQVVRGKEFRNLARNNSIRRVYIPACRGRVVDRDNHLLVDNRPSFDVVLVSEPGPLLADSTELLAECLDMESDDVARHAGARALVPYLPAVLKRDVSRETAARVAEIADHLPGVELAVRPVRSYPGGEAAAHITGYVGAVTREELYGDEERRYNMQDVVGRRGVEQFLDEDLRGSGGGKQVRVDSRGFLVEVVSSRRPVAGKDVKLTVSLTLQKAVQEAFSGFSGAAVVMDCHSGQILSLCSFPSYDPNLFVSAGRGEDVTTLFRDPAHPLVNRCLRGRYPPGSLFKTIVSLAGLDKGTLRAHSTAVCNGQFELGSAVFRCWRPEGHGSMDLVRALKFSCNVFFYRYALKIGPDAICTMAQRFDLGKRTGCAYESESAGLLPSPAWKRASLREKWYGGDTVNLSIGQGYLLTTPIQVVRWMAALANGGVLVTPTILAQNTSRGVQRNLELSDSLLQNVKEGMRRVVLDVDGTGHRAYVPEMPAGGKTGTVQISSGESAPKHAWFAGFAPYASPEIAFAIIVEDAESGGVTAAPIAAEILKAYAWWKSGSQKEEAAS